MPRQFQDELTKQALIANATGEVFLELITIEHDNLAQPLRFVNNTQNITSRSNEYIAFNFSFRWPDEEEEQLSAGKLIIGNVDRQIVQTIRALSTKPTFTIELIRADAPDVVEMGPMVGEILEASADILLVEGTIGRRSILDKKSPLGQYIPAYFPGLFNNVTGT